jgi:hypothetical protein
MMPRLATFCQLHYRMVLSLLSAIAPSFILKKKKSELGALIYTDVWSFDNGKFMKLGEKLVSQS